MNKFKTLPYKTEKSLALAVGRMSILHSEYDTYELELLVVMRKLARAIGFWQ